MPDKKERDLWWAFLAGRPESEWNPPKKPKQPKPSRWQQRTQKRQQVGLPEAQEDTSLPYDLGETSFSGSVSDIPDSSAATYPLSTPSNGSVGIDEPLQPLSAGPGPPIEAGPKVENGGVPLIYTPREPTPALLQHIDHVRRSSRSMPP